MGKKRHLKWQEHILISDASWASWTIDVISVFTTERVTRFTVRVLPTCGGIFSIEYG